MRRYEMHNEIEERRVEKALERLAASVRPLAEDELTTLARAATRPERPLRSRRRAPRLVAAGAAAACAFGVAAAAVVDEGRDDGSSSAVGPTRIAEFPEGSPVQILITSARDER